TKINRGEQRSGLLPKIPERGSATRSASDGPSAQKSLAAFALIRSCCGSQTRTPIGLFAILSSMPLHWGLDWGQSPLAQASASGRLILYAYVLANPRVYRS